MKSLRGELGEFVFLGDIAFRNAQDTQDEHGHGAGTVTAQGAVEINRLVIIDTIHDELDALTGLFRIILKHLRITLFDNGSAERIFAFGPNVLGLERALREDVAMATEMMRLYVSTLPVTRKKAYTGSFPPKQESLKAG